MSKRYLFIVMISLIWLTGCTSQENFEINEPKNQNLVSDSQNDDNLNTQGVIDDSKAVENEAQYDEKKSDPIIYGTWKLEKVVLISEEFDTISPEGRVWYGREEEFLGEELEFSQDYIRLGEEEFPNPDYTSKYITFDEYKSGGKFRQPHPYEVIEVEGINVMNRDKYEDLASVELLNYYIEFDEDYPLPFGTFVIILNEDTMFVGGWGKVALAYRVN